MGYNRRPDWARIDGVDGSGRFVHVVDRAHKYDKPHPSFHGVGTTWRCDCGRVYEVRGRWWRHWRRIADGGGDD